MYKSGQGYWTRVMTAIAAGVMACLGAAWLWDLLVGIRFGDIPPVYIAAGAAVLLVAIAGWFIYYFVAVKPASVDFLVATEGEMKKVNWSTRREIVGSTWVVLFVSLAVTLFVFLFDNVFFFTFVWMKVLDAAA